MKREISQELLRDRLDYNPITGVFTWIKCPKHNSLVGTRAGTPDTYGHIRISIYNKPHAAHRLAWMYSYGEWPKGVIDHINGDPADNRIANLRDVTQSINLRNQRKPKRGSKTGAVGVSWDPVRRKFYAQIAVDHKHYALGRFNTTEEASEAYLKAKSKLHGGYPMERAA